ncbi:lipocalin family protein [Gordonia sp. (in: high G+C Gram-positive bacteria)]|uniref:lipocalin family protein n=1 Tax=Gordonia sp. (in: high G+C Gram-positive bacteria) TaxID=84139 RepID=UPI0039E32290
MTSLRRAAASAAVALTALGLGTLDHAAAQGAPATLQPVAKLDVHRYLGAWWQQAAVPGFYSLRCARDTVATYSLIDATTVKVDNKCIGPLGNPDGIKGQAKVVDTKTNAQLSVSFPGIPGTIDAGGRANYVVAWVADGARPSDPYRYAIVGDPYRLSGYILSRDKVISHSTLLWLRSQAEKVGFNSCTLLVSPTTGGRSDYTPLCLLR